MLGESSLLGATNLVRSKDMPRSLSQQSPGRSNRFWQALKPPPAVSREETGEWSPNELRRRKRLLVVTAAAILVGISSWGVYLYVASAPTRAEAALLEGTRLMASGKYSAAMERFTK